MGEQRLALQPVNLLVGDYIAIRVLMEPYLRQQRKSEILRLVVKINYQYSIIYMRVVGTHAEYDKIDATTI